MHRHNSENISDILSRILRKEGLDAPLAEYRLVQAWPQVAGEMVQRQTTEIRISNQTLLVRLRSASMRQILHMRRAQLVADLNRAAGKQVIVDIRFI